MQHLMRCAAVAALLIAGPAFAQVQGADPDFLKHALDALQAQRNRAMDEAAGAEAQLARAQAQIEALTKERDDLIKAKQAPAEAPKP